MRRGFFLLTLAVLAAGCSESPANGSGAAPPEAEAGDRRPNVVLVVIDTLRADHLSSYGFPQALTPNLDRIAEEGALFERAVAAAPSTIPSHVAMLTSRYAREVGAGFVTGEGRLTSQQTLAAAFRDAGYATGAFVSNPVLRAAWGFDHGFDVYDHELAPRILPGARTVRERVAESTTARALDWVGEVRDRPFLLWVHYQDPHGPYGAPEPFAGRFRVPPWPGDRPLRHLKSNVGTRGVPLYQVLEGLVEPAAYRSRYADEVHYADHWVGTLWASLEAHASGRDTVWLFTSDHGEALGEDEHYFLHEVTTTPELAHVPFLVRAPGLAPGRHRDPVGHVDVLPTLLELAGLPVPEGLRGTALGPLLREGRPFPDRSLYCDRGKEVSAYRRGGFVRATGVVGAASVDEGAESTRYAWWTWGDDGRFVAREELAADAELEAFVRGTVPVEPAPMDGDVEEQLRALGYLEDEADAAP